MPKASFCCLFFLSVPLCFLFSFSFFFFFFFPICRADRFREDAYALSNLRIWYPKRCRLLFWDDQTTAFWVFDSLQPCRHYRSCSNMSLRQSQHLYGNYGMVPKVNCLRHFTHLSIFYYLLYPCYSLFPFLGVGWSARGSFYLCIIFILNFD